MADTHRFRAALWEAEGPSAWYFVSVPDDVADDIAERSRRRTAGFGSVRVEVTIGASRWRTSVFPDSRRGTYLLPVKKAIRQAESLADGSAVDLQLRLVDADAGEECASSAG